MRIVKKVIEKSRIVKARKAFDVKNGVSLICQNCIGGVFYHDMKLQFLSPTINLYFDADNFIKFISNIDYYVNTELQMHEGEECPIGEIDDVTIHFLHYKNCEEAYNKWNERKKRIINEKIFIICTDRDGFTDEQFNQFKLIKYPKILFTRNAKWKEYDFCIYLEKYREYSSIPDIIPYREFYYNNSLISKLNNQFS